VFKSYRVRDILSFSHPAESCGLNGLPLTPHSISILGAAQILLTCNLARYLDIQRGKHQRIVVVGGSCSNNLRHTEQGEITEEKLLSISQQVLLASAYLNQMNIVNLNISRENVMLTEEGQVKLFNYGPGRMTNYGTWVAFTVGDPRLTAPEVFRLGSRVDQVPTIKE
jgi:TBC domain-containing protein kinase-like protein